MTTDQTSFDSFHPSESHMDELRASLTVIIGRSQLLQRHLFRGSPPTERELVKALDLIVGHSWKVARLLDSRQKQG